MTAEEQAAYVAALEHEKTGLQARIARLKDGKPDSLTSAELEERISGIDAEVARVTGAPAAKKQAAKAAA